MIGLLIKRHSRGKIISRVLHKINLFDLRLRLYQHITISSSRGIERHGGTVFVLKNFILGLLLDSNLNGREYILSRSRKASKLLCTL